MLGAAGLTFSTLTEGCRQAIQNVLIQGQRVHRNAQDGMTGRAEIANALVLVFRTGSNFNSLSLDVA